MFLLHNNASLETKSRLDASYLIGGWCEFLLCGWAILGGGQLYAKKCALYIRELRSYAQHFFYQ